MSKLKIALSGIALVIFVITITATNDYGQEGKQREYVGTSKCKMCHMSAKKGGQYESWKKSLHSKAYETLGTAEAKKVGAEHGVKDPQNDPKCLKCHVTAYGVDKKYLGDKYDMKDGVGCESCHGAGGDYFKMNIMKQITEGKVKAADYGLVLPNEQVCITCHNSESPTFKEFNFAEMYKKIAHPMPEEYMKEKGYPVK